MKKLIIACLAASAFVAFADDNASSTAAAELLKHNKKDFLLLRAGGGKVEKPGTKKGEIVIVNAQTAASSSWIDEQLAYFNKETHFNVTQRSGSFSLPSPKVEGNMTIYVVDDPALPVSLIAPENRWAMMNIATLKSDKPAFYEARVKKALSRTFGQLCGGMASNFQLSLVGPVTKTEDLDQFPSAQLPFDILERMRFYMSKFGVEPAKIATYRKACAEGWAPQPSNDVQRIIWEEMHSKPTEPMRIKYDPAKGE